MSLQRRFKKPASASALTITSSKHIGGLHDEDHHSVSYYAKKWGFSDDFLRPIFQNELGVLKAVRPEDPNAVVVREGKKKKGKRAYISLRIPESVAARVHERLHGKIAA